MIRKLVKGMTEKQDRIYDRNVKCLPGLLVSDFLFCESIDLPGPPRDLKVSDVTRGTCRLTWKPPENDGGERVKSYFIEEKAVGGKAWTKV